MIQNLYVLAEIGIFKGNPQSYMIFSKPLTTTHHHPYTQFIIADQSWYFNWITPIIREVFLVPHPIPTTSIEFRLCCWGGGGVSILQTTPQNSIPHAVVSVGVCLFATWVYPIVIVITTFTMSALEHKKLDRMVFVPQ